MCKLVMETFNLSIGHLSMILEVPWEKERKKGQQERKYYYNQN